MQLKEDNGLYGRFPWAAQVVAVGGGRYQVQATFAINTRIAPGTYRVRVTAVRSQHVMQQPQVQWQVELAGSSVFLTLKRPVLYGTLALGLAAVVGFLSGVLFKQREKGSRE